MTLFDQIIQILTDNATLLCVAAFIIGMTVWGCHRGIMIRMLSLLSIVATLFIEAQVYPQVIETLRQNEAVTEFFDEMGERIIGTAAGSFAESLSSAAGEQLLIPDMAEIFAGSSIYSAIGADGLIENAGAAIGDMVFKVICFIVIFVVIRLLVRVLSLLVMGLRHIYVIRWLDGFGGMLFGACEALLYVWIFMFIVSAFPQFELCKAVLKQIAESNVLTLIYDSNIITYIFLMLAGM